MPYKDRKKQYECEKRSLARRKAKDPNAWSVWSSLTHKKYIEKTRDAAYEKLGNRCSSPLCRWINLDGTRGCTEKKCLQVDHVNGDGYLERKLGMYGLYKKVMSDTEGAYQLLCANCNWIKKVDNKEIQVRHRKAEAACA
jgi:hypothetical protein